jgi:ASC-1-like (ASCH) protein
LFRFSECEEAHLYRVLHLPELQQIARGEKTIDARVILPHKRAVIPGDSIVFRYSRNQVEMDEWRLTCKAVAVKRYATFRELLEAEGIERCVPGCVDLDKAIEMCHRSGLVGKNSRQSEQKHGVIAIHVKAISTLTEVAAASDERKKSRS